MYKNNIDGCLEEGVLLEEIDDNVKYWHTNDIYSEKLSTCPKCGNKAYIRLNSNGKYCHPAVLCDNCDEAWKAPFIDMTIPQNSDVTYEKIIEKMTDMWNKRQFV